MMLIARAPMRISLGGGGTDLPAYYRRYGGLVVSTSISRCFYTVLTTASSNGIEIISADYRTLCQHRACKDLILDESLQLPHAVIDYFKLRDGLVVFLASEVPPGSGLGVPATVAVSMIKALGFWSGIDLESATVADIACRIQIDKLGMPVGKQDQYAAAFGGLNLIRFSKDAVTVEPLRLPSGVEDKLEKGLMLFYTNAPRQPCSILQHVARAVRERDEDTLRRLETIKEIAQEVSNALEQGDLAAFGELLHRSWMEKRQLTTGITNSFIDRCYQTALEHGAVGGKIAGAGGGGFLMLYCPIEHQEAVTDALTDLGLRRWSFTLDCQGVQVMQATPWRRPQLWQRSFPGQHEVRPGAAESYVGLANTQAL